jgi:hypothetical protein
VPPEKKSKTKKCFHIIKYPSIYFIFFYLHVLDLKHSSPKRQLKLREKLKFTYFENFVHQLNGFITGVSRIVLPLVPGCCSN